MAETPVDWQEEVVIDSPVKVKMHYFGTEAEQAEEAEEEQSASTVRHGFLVGDQGYLVAADTDAEIINKPPICGIPNTPAGFLGFINHRGDTVPVFYIPGFEDPNAVVQGRWVLLIGQGAKTLGLLVTEPPMRLREEWLKQPDDFEVSEPLKPCLGTSYQRGLQLWTEFDHHEFCQLVRQQFKQN